MRQPRTGFSPGVWLALGVLLSTAVAAQPRAKPAPAQLPPGTEAFPPEVARALEARIREQFEGRLLGGLSVGIAKGDLAWTGGFGFRDIEKRLRATPRTTYRTASITKSFTALCVLQLVEAGTVSLDDDIRKWVPEFPAKPWPVTVRQLLGHLGGVSHYKDPKEHRVTKRMTTAEALAIFKDWPLVVEPGTEFTYSSYGYNLLWALVERASGMPFGKYLQQHVFGPAGMQHAALDDFKTRDAWQAVGYRPTSSGLAHSFPLDVSSRFGGGGGRASVVDLLAFGRAVMASTLVKPETGRMMQVSMETRDGRLTDYGMGFATYPLRGHYVVAHAGGQPETSTFLLIIPAERLVIALESNVEDQADLLRDIYSSLLEVLLEGGTRRRPVYATDPVDEVLHEGLYRIFSYGRAFYTFHQAGLGNLPEPGDLPSAFAEASQLLSREAITTDLRAAQKLLKQAHHPRTGKLFIRVGVQMAERIASALGPEALAAYPAEGALPFFEDYLRACEKEHCPEELRFSPGVRSEIARLVGPWRKANAPELRKVSLRSVPDLPLALETLQKVLQDAPVHPDYSEEVLEMAKAPKTAPEQAARLLDWALKNHPGSIPTLLARADQFLLAGDTEAAELLYRRAFERPAGPDALAPEKLLARAKHAPVGLGILQIAVKLHPGAPGLWRALAIREQEAGNTAAAETAVVRVKELSALPSPPPDAVQAAPTQ
ncbi:serine hydrolase domain-containing protein [Hyalangium versicolor]|uniref:serine hydrolase domain-containing protein n=1 Tax=Hyalangium versicolor TaxID=2861190 RepID=UPI001CCCEB90|nr:serine hydrolase domain-containing protein [Hyalangium versicolor]